MRILGNSNGNVYLTPNNTVLSEDDPVRGVKVNGTELTKDSDGKVDIIMGYTTVSVSIAVGDWSNKQAIKTVTGVTSSNLVQISVSPSDLDKWCACACKATTQGTDSLTFTCNNVPASSITLEVVIWQ